MAAPKTIADLGVPAQADSADETYVLVAFSPAILLFVQVQRMQAADPGPRPLQAARFGSKQRQNQSLLESAAMAV